MPPKRKISDHFGSSSSSSSSDANASKVSKASVVAAKLSPYEQITEDIKQKGATLDKEPLMVVGIRMKEKQKGEEDEEEEEDSEDEEVEYDDEKTYAQMKAKVKVIYVGKGFAEYTNQFYRNIMNADCRAEKLHDPKNKKKLVRLTRQLHWKAADVKVIKQQCKQQASMASWTDDSDDEDAGNAKEDEEDDCHGFMFNTTSGYLMAQYLIRELQVLAKEEKKEKEKKKKFGDILDKLLALTEACTAMNHWFCDFDDVVSMSMFMRSLSAMYVLKLIMLIEFCHGNISISLSVYATFITYFIEWRIGEPMSVFFDGILQHTISLA